MANPLYQKMNPGAPSPGGGNFMQAFPQFMQQMRGQNPNQMLQQLLTSGKISQAQLDQAQQMARQMGGQFSQFRGMFGFK
jgi:hypothetical protein